MHRESVTVVGHPMIGPIPVPLVPELTDTHINLDILNDTPVERLHTIFLGVFKNISPP